MASRAVAKPSDVSSTAAAGEEEKRGIRPDFVYGAQESSISEQQRSLWLPPP
ncbi:Hypothetical predicted protein [Podarcis lilfordi]|uniref:Uncharacterized protein n=1 Tax=Podarcis lilfordi TaxID=74358 RepID=A0AA35LA07_9SAUR|nr:Hypothetical predicted protein [Podarcis lilfordi]